MQEPYAGCGFGFMDRQGVSVATSECVKGNLIGEGEVKEITR